MKRTLIAMAIALSSSAAYAAIELPQPSPASTLTQAVGVSKVTINYHRPGVKGRKIWGELVPYGKVWRLGANEATTVELSHDAKIAGNAVPAGKYALFAIPSEKEWTLVINKQPEQWGSYFYKQENDVVRFNVKPASGEAVEWMEFTMTPKPEGTIVVELAWEKLRVSFPVEFATEKIAWANIDTALAKADPNIDKSWSDYLQAARYALETGNRMDEAMVWIDKAMGHESFWNYELKGRLLQKQGKTAEAIPLMEKAMETAKGKAPQEYIDGLGKQVAEWKK